MRRSTQVLMSVTLIALCATSCGRKKKESEVDYTGSLKELGLANAMLITVPKSALGLGEVTGAGLLAGKKSRDACLARNFIKTGLEVTTTVAQALCYMENEASVKAAGGKFHIDAGEDNDRLDINVERKKPTETKKDITISVCEGGVLTDKIEIEAYNSAGAKGSWTQYITNADNNYSMYLEFDKFQSDTARSSFLIKQAYMGKDGESDYYSFIMKTEISDQNNPSKVMTRVRFAADGVSSVDQYSGGGTTKISRQYGSAITKFSAGRDGKGRSYPAVVDRDYFNAVGDVVPSNETSDFKEQLKVESGDVPKFLGPKYKGPNFKNSDWDCSGASTVASAKNPALDLQCDAMVNDADYEWEDCWDDSLYINGESIPDFTPSGVL